MTSVRLSSEEKYIELTEGWHVSNDVIGFIYHITALGLHHAWTISGASQIFQLSGGHGFYLGYFGLLTYQTGLA